MQLHVFKKLCVPQRLKIAPQRLFVIGIAFAAENTRLQSVGANSPISDEIDPVDDFSSLWIAIPRLLLFRREVFKLFFFDVIRIQEGVKKVGVFLR